jgi:hypothetical protein
LVNGPRHSPPFSQKAGANHKPTILMANYTSGPVISQGGAEYSALDFCVIALLEEVKHAVILPKINNEWRELFVDYKNDPEKEREIRNLAAGLLGIWELAKLSEDRIGQREELGRFVWDTGHFDEGKLYLLLKRYGHYLFNSYYYTLLNEFGDEGLVPVIPGETRPSSESGQRRLSDFIKRSQIPLHLNETYLDTYSTLHLPLRAGITPRYLELYHTGDPGTKSSRVPNFLGDLGILEKREDYFHRHLCAVISIFGKQGDRQGAFILTSAIPGALNGEDMKRLTNVITSSWDIAPLANVHRDMSRTIRSISTHVKWTGQDDQTNTAGQEEEQLKANIQQSLASMGSEGAYVLRGAFYDDDRRLCQFAALNSEGIQRVLKCQFPTSPWLDPRAINRAGSDPNELLIDTERLENLCRAFEKLSLPGEENAEVRAEAFIHLTANDSLRGISDAIFPDAATNHWSAQDLTPDVVVLSGGSQNGRMLIFQDPSIGEDETRLDGGDLRGFGEWVHNALQRSELPGSRNSQLAHLQREWNKSQGRANESSNAESSAQPIRNLCNMFERSAIRGIFILVDDTIFIPEFVQVGMPALNEMTAKHAAFRTAFCSYPSFWLFESVCHSLTEEIKISSLQAAGDLGGTSYPFRWSGDQTGYTVIRSTLPSIDSQVATAFTYMGVPIREWRPPGSVTDEGDPWRMPSHESELQGWINARYRDYISDCLRMGDKYEAIRRAIGSNDAGFRVASIEIPHFSSDSVEMKATLEGDTEPVHIKWRKVPTVDLAFCALSGESLCLKHAAVFSVPGNTKSGGLHVETIQANGEQVVPEAGSASLKALDQALYERSQTLRWGIQRGLLSKFILFNHEARTGLEMINRLFKVPLTQSLRTQGRMVQILNHFLKTPLSQQNNDPSLIDEVELAKLGALILELSFGSVLGAPPAVPLLDISPSADAHRYLHEVIKLGVARGVSERTTSMGDNSRFTVSTARLLMTNLTDSIVSSMDLDLYGKTLAHSGPSKWKSQEIIVVLISNAIKHMLVYLLNHLDGPRELISLPIEFWKRAIGLRIDGKANCLTVENVGPPRDLEYFRSRFKDRAVKGTLGTYAVLQATVEDTEAWGTGPGAIELQVRKLDGPPLRSKHVSENARSRLNISHLFIVRVHLPQNFLEAPHHGTQTSTETYPNNRV